MSRKRVGKERWGIKPNVTTAGSGTLRNFWREKRTLKKGGRLSLERLHGSGRGADAKETLRPTRPRKPEIGGKKQRGAREPHCECHGGTKKKRATVKFWGILRWGKGQAGGKSTTGHSKKVQERAERRDDGGLPTWKKKGRPRPGIRKNEKGTMYRRVAKHSEKREKEVGGQG